MRLANTFCLFAAFSLPFSLLLKREFVGLSHAKGLKGHSCVAASDGAKGRRGLPAATKHIYIYAGHYKKSGHRPFQPTVGAPPPSPVSDYVEPSPLYFVDLNFIFASNDVTVESCVPKIGLATPLRSSRRRPWPLLAGSAVCCVQEVKQGLSRTLVRVRRLCVRM